MMIAGVLVNSFVNRGAIQNCLDETIVNIALSNNH